MQSWERYDIIITVCGRHLNHVRIPFVFAECREIRPYQPGEQRVLVPEVRYSRGGFLF